MSLGVALNFNATAVEPATAFQAIEPGWYDAKIDESEMKPTKDGSGAYLKLRFSIIGGKHNNQKVFQNLNLKNANPTAVEIAQKQLSAICHSVNVLQLQNSAQLHGIPLKIKVKVRKDPTGQYEDSNEISGYENINAAVQMAPSYSGGASVPPAGFGMPAASAGFGAPAGFAAPPATQAPAAAQSAAQPWQQPPAPAAAPAAQPAPVAPPPAAQGEPATPAWANGTATAAPATQAPAAAAPAGNWTPQQAEVSQNAQTASPPWATAAQEEQPAQPEQ
jgi:hypothetical protein